MDRKGPVYECRNCKNRWEVPKWHKCVERYGPEIFKATTWEEITLQEEKTRQEQQAQELLDREAAERQARMEEEARRYPDEVNQAVLRYYASTDKRASRHVKKLYSDKPRLYQVYQAVSAWMNKFANTQLKYRAAGREVTFTDYDRGGRPIYGTIGLLKGGLRVVVPRRNIAESFHDLDEVRDTFVPKAGRVQDYVTETYEKPSLEPPHHRYSIKKHGPFGKKLR